MKNQAVKKRVSARLEKRKLSLSMPIFCHKKIEITSTEGDN